jgi:hypothetical protein
MNVLAIQHSLNTALYDFLMVCYGTTPVIIVYKVLKKILYGNPSLCSYLVETNSRCACECCLVKLCWMISSTRVPYNL